MMNKYHKNISSLAELELEERRVRARLRKKETELLVRAKRLPEEAATAALVKLLSAILRANTLKTLVNFAKKAGKRTFFSVFFKDLF